MASRRSFKSDESFLEKISIGAVGTRQVFKDLDQQGHQPIELERGSMSFKIWKTIKIKRIRVPDILCVACNRRVESRAKTNLEISMSHSQADSSRAWDFGLEDNDYVAFVVCYRVGDEPVDWRAEELVQYIQVRDLREAFRQGQVYEENPKGAQEGFEIRLTWPSATASADGRVVRISDERFQFMRLSDDRTISLSRTQKGILLTPLVHEGDVVCKNQVILSTVPVIRAFDCEQSATEQTYTVQLYSPSLSEKYAAAKALSHFGSPAVKETLACVLPTKEHIYIRLEAAASLARLGDERGLAFIRDCLSGDYINDQLEAVIVLGEIRSPEAVQILIDMLLNDNLHSEIRAGAAWALGETRDKAAIGALIQSFLAVDVTIRIEAARALAKLTDTSSQTILEALAQNDPSRRPGIAWALGKSEHLSIEDFLKALVDDDARRWVAYIIGMQDSQKHIHQIEALKLEDPEVYFAVTVLWQIMSSWIYDLKEYG
jgi:hypothetical protein